MAQMVSRRRIAQHVADEYLRGVALADVLTHVAAYLIDTRRTREANLVARAIEDELALRGHVVARVSSARPLDEALRNQVTALIGGEHVYLDEHIDASLIGGVKIETPVSTLDTTIKRKLLALRQAKV